MDLGHTGGRGTPVLAVQPGVVADVLSDSDRRRAYAGYGNGVVVHHPDDDTWALYAHMDRVDVAEGQQVSAGQQLGAMGNSSNGKFPGMGVHLHVELRRRRSNGQPPFPGPYPRSIRQPFNSLDPRPWMESRGLAFGSRGAFEIRPNTEMAMTRPVWSSLGLMGVDPYPSHRISPWASRRFPETAMAGLGEKAISTADAESYPYEPPAHFDRDVRFGLRPIEWAATGAGVLVAVGTGVAFYVRRRMRPNRRRRTSRR